MRARFAVAVAGRPRSEDRAEVFELDDTLVVVVADGAGGLSGGAAASAAIVEAVRARLAHRMDPFDLRAWSELFTTTDAALRAQHAGETTAIVAAIAPHGVAGVSVGDSEAWVVGPQLDPLTKGQDRARLGTGRCRPTWFHRRRLDGVLVVATDGLFRHARRDAIAIACADPDATAIAEALVTLPRLPSGAYPDDVAVVVVLANA